MYEVSIPGGHPECLERGERGAERAEQFPLPCHLQDGREGWQDYESLKSFFSHYQSNSSRSLVTYSPRGCRKDLQSIQLLFLLQNQSQDLVAQRGPSEIAQENMPLSMEHIHIYADFIGMVVMMEMVMTAYTKTPDFKY